MCCKKKFICSIFVVLVLGLLSNASAEIAFDAASSAADGGGGTVLSWSHTIGSGSDRVLIVAALGEDNRESDMAIVSVKYNGVNMTEVSGSSKYLEPVKSDLYYMLDADLPPAGTYTVEITYSSTVSDLAGGAISLTGVEQQTAEAVVTNSASDSTVISTNITTLTDGAWVVDLVGADRKDTFTTTSTGMVERFDENTSETHTAAGSTRPVASAGQTTMSWQFNGGSSSMVHSVAAFTAAGAPPAGPVADFSGSPLSGPAPLTVNFTDQSTGEITSWSWTFGDGDGSEEQNPSHTYTAEGTYTVTLEVTGPGGSDTETKVDYITVSPVLVAEFSGSPLSGDGPLTVNFTDLSTGDITGWDWTFGDGGSSTAQNPSHEYTSAGTYTVTLEVTGPGGSDTETKVDYINVTSEAPVPDFYGTPTSGPWPLTVQFYDLSTGPISNWKWRFDPDDPEAYWNTSTGGDPPPWTYTAAGQYTVSLEITDARDGSTRYTETKANYITVTEPVAPTAAFSGTPTSGPAPLTVTFTDESTGTVSEWNWNFGDTATSTEQNPVHTYQSEGVYTVILDVNGVAGSDTHTEVGYITVTAPEIPVAAFSGSPLSGNAPLTVNFNDQSTGSIDSWSWDFGDGGTSTQQSPTYQYTSAGTYTVSLTVTGAYGSDTETKINFITVKAADAEFTGSPTSGDYPLTVNFTDQSTGSIDSWSWDFGDDGTSTAQNPSHEYTYAGNFTVSLTVTGAYGSDTETKPSYIQVGTPAVPVAAFSGSPTSGLAPLTVDFTDQSTGEIDSWSWDFGDGGSSTAQNPTYEYADTGVYTVSLTVSGPSGSDTKTNANYITVQAPQYEEQWTTYDKTTTGGGIQDNDIRDIKVASDGTVWVATLGGGISEFDGTNWTYYKTTQGLASNSAWDICIDESTGNVWIATADGVSKYDGTSFTTWKNGAEGLTNDNLRAVAIESSGIVWVGSYGGGIFAYDGSSWTQYNTSNSDLPHNRVWDIDIDASDNLWIATEGGAAYFDGTNWEVYVNELLSDDVFALDIANDGSVWFATLRGINKFDGSTWSEWDVDDGLSKNNCKSIGVAPDGIVWAGTYGAGLNEFDGTTFTVYKTTNSPLTNNYVWAATPESALEVWIGNNKGVNLREMIEIVGPAAPVADFTASPTIGDAPLTVNFTDASQNEVTSWSWTFGDGGTSVEQNPSHTYQDAGTYSVSLEVTGPGGSDMLTQTDYITVNPAPPIPDFVASPLEGLPPLTVTFTDQSTGCIDTWKYDFDGDGTDDWSDSSTGSTQWTYTEVGLYTVSLKVRDCETSQYYTETKPDHINVRAPIPPTAAFSAIPTSGSVPLTVTFTDESTGDDVDSWSWNFGDGGTSTEQNPVHVYNTEGLYDVTLTASSAYGTDTLTQTDYIDVGPPQPADANFSGEPQLGFAPLDVAFTDLSTGSITSWNWTFGDGGTSTEQHPTHMYSQPDTYTVTLEVTGPLNSDTMTKTDYITVETAPTGGSGLAFVDSPDDLTNTHPHLWCRGYGPDNGLWQKAQTTHSAIWQRLSDTAPRGSYPASPPLDDGDRTTGQQLMRAAMAFVISKDPDFGSHCQDAIRKLNGYDWGTSIGALENLYAYALAYDALVDDPQTQWLTSQEKADALWTMANAVSTLNSEPGATWRVRPTHNLQVLRAGAHAACLYNLRGESGYEDAFNTGRQYCLAYHNERVNGLCDAPLSNEGPRPSDGFPYEGPSYGAYQGTRALIHRHILELNEYPNVDTVLDENKSGFSQNYNLAWMAVLLPGAQKWADVAYRGDHAVTQAIRYYSAVNKAVGTSDKAYIPPATMAGVGEWFVREIWPTILGDNDHGWWQGWEMFWYDASIDPVHPDDAGVPLYVHLDDAEFHMYRDSWNAYNASPDDTYVYFRNSGHDGHNYWDEGHSGPDLTYECRVQTSSHDGADNGHFGIWRNGEWISENASPQGETDRHACILIDGVGQHMDSGRGYEFPEYADTDVVGAVDSDYGHALDAIIGPAYPAGTVSDYRRFLFVIRNPMYVISIDELESGHTMTWHLYGESGGSQQASDLWTSPRARYELMYPASGYTSSSGVGPITITTGSPQLMFLVHANPSGVSVSKSVTGGDVVATVGQDDIVYNPDGSSYTHGNISGDAKLFAERTGGALIFKATSASGSQYGVSCDAAVSMSVSGRNASIYVYGTGTHTVTVTSPYGTDVFDTEADQTVERVLTGTSVAAPVADFFAVPTEGWDIYCQPEFISTSTGWITDYLWEFGDGTTSTELAPHHKYAVAGLYTVKLTVGGPGGSDTMVKEQYIYIKDFASGYNYPDYILTEATQAAFDAALDAIEASQTPYETYPEWCAITASNNWCDLMQYGGGGRILFSDSIAGSTFYVNWDDRIDSRNPSGDSDRKRDWFGDNLIIDGQDKNITFYYNGSQPCGQTENMSCLRIHGCDNIVRNITWDRFPDGLHMRHGMRNLVEGITTNVVCEDAQSFNGSGGSCVDCIARNCTYGASTDKTVMNSAADGWQHGAPARVVICGMHSTNGNQPIRCGSDDRSSMTIVRNSTFLGNTAGPRFGGDQYMVIFENNYVSSEKTGQGGVRLGEEVHAWVRNNTLENGAGYGIWCHGTGAFARIENNIIWNNASGGVQVLGPSNFDLGGGLVDLYETNPYAVTGPGATPAPSYGRNTIMGNAVADLLNQLSGDPQPEVKAENNFWDHTTVSEVLANDVSGAADVDPLAEDID